MVHQEGLHMTGILEMSDLEFAKTVAKMAANEDRAHGGARFCKNDHRFPVSPLAIYNEVANRGTPKTEGALSYQHWLAMLWASYVAGTWLPITNIMKHGTLNGDRSPVAVSASLLGAIEMVGGHVMCFECWLDQRRKAKEKHSVSETTRTK